MSKTIVQVLGFSSELLSEAASRFGNTQTVSRQVVSKLKKSNSLAKTFIPKAKEPNVKWGFNKGGSSQSVNFTFRDGERALTRGNFTASENGRIDYDFTFVNSQTGAQTVSTRGFCNPNEPLFSSSQHGAGYAWDNGELTIHTHSTGFSNDTTTNKEFLCDIGKQIKDFFSAVFTKDRTSQLFTKVEGKNEFLEEVVKKLNSPDTRVITRTK